jgi:hypothetical protein
MSDALAAAQLYVLDSRSRRDSTAARVSDAMHAATNSSSDVLVYRRTYSTRRFALFVDSDIDATEARQAKADCSRRNGRLCRGKFVLPPPPIRGELVQEVYVVIPVYSHMQAPLYSPTTPLYLAIALLKSSSKYKSVRDDSSSSFCVCRFSHGCL